MDLQRGCPTYYGRQSLPKAMKASWRNNFAQLAHPLLDGRPRHKDSGFSTEHYASRFLVSFVPESRLACPRPHNSAAPTVIFEWARRALPSKTLFGSAE